MIAILDYDAGNTKSVEKALHHLGAKTILTRNRDEILNASGVILPGVGAFGNAMEQLHAYHLVETIQEVVKKKLPFLGVCLGLQLLFEESEESPGVKGLGLLEGKILRFPEGEWKVPHIGWNDLSLQNHGRLFQGLDDHAYVYFVHSYYLKAKDPSIVVAKTNYGIPFDSSVEYQNIFGCQFHPEKSSQIGLAILKNFLSICEESSCIPYE